MENSIDTIIGVDGGGTGCRVAVCSRSGRRLAEARGGEANYMTDPDGSVRNVLGALQAALSDAGLGNGAPGISAAHVGLAGVLTDAQARTLAAALPFDRVSVSDDRITSAAGALGPKEGVLAAIGTGSFVVRRRKSAHRFFGGWGLQVGDQASGAWLGRTLLERCLLVGDGVLEGSDLIGDTLARFERDPRAIVSFARQALPRDYAALAPAVVDAARAGDANGLALMQAGADYLMRCIELDPPDPNDVVCLLGGVGPHYASYLGETIRERLRPALGNALDGALQLARDNHIKSERAE